MDIKDNINISDSSSGGIFVTADELNNMNFLSDRQLSEGKEQFSNIKQWTKSMKDIEAEQKNKQEIIAEIRKLEEKIDYVLKKLEQIETNAGTNAGINNATNYKTNSTWKDKIKIW